MKSSLQNGREMRGGSGWLPGKGGKDRTGAGMMESYKTPVMGDLSTSCTSTPDIACPEDLYVLSCTSMSDRDCRDR